MSPRTGRPTDCRKDHDLKVRVSDEMNKRLLDYCDRNDLTKAEAIRRAIIMFLDASK